MAPVIGADLKKHISLPYRIPDSPLEILELAEYEGVYLEDGTVEEVARVAALLIRNCGSELLEEGQVDLWQNGRKLRFSFEFLPPGQTLMALEIDRLFYQPGPVTRCTGSAKPAQEGLGKLLKIVQEGGCTLHITNESTAPLENILIRFKNLDPETGIYMGGIAYEIRIRALAPGQTYTCRPWYFLAGQSVIVHTKISGLPS